MSKVPPLTGALIAGAWPLPRTSPTPEVGETVKAADVQLAVQGLLNQDRTIEERGAFNTVAKPAGNPLTYAFTGTPGIIVTILAQINAAEVGDIAMPNASTPKITLNSGNTGRAVAVDLQVTSEPAGNANPGVDNLLTGVNILKASFSVRFNGDTTVTIHEGGRYNIASIVINGINTQADITFVRPFAASQFSISGSIGEPADTTWKHGNKATTGFSLVFFPAGTGGGSPINLNTTAVEFDCHIFGRQ